MVARAITGISVGTPTLLTIIFVVLKLTKKIDWSWLWVLSPLIIWFMLGLILTVIIIGGFMLYGRVRQ